MSTPNLDAPTLDALVALLAPKVAAAQQTQQPQQPFDLEALLAAVAALLQQQDDKVFTRKEFCARNRIKDSYWFKMKREGTGPRTIRKGAQELVTASAEKEYRARKEKESESRAAKLSDQRRRRLAKKAAEKGVTSEKHPHPRGSGKEALTAGKRCVD